jgi:hypothetical protein
VTEDNASHLREVKFDGYGPFIELMKAVALHRGPCGKQCNLWLAISLYMSISRRTTISDNYFSQLENFSRRFHAQREQVSWEI